MAVEGLPRKLSLAVIPYAFVLPAVGVLGDLPAVSRGADDRVQLRQPRQHRMGRPRTTTTGCSNSEQFHITLVNNVLWILIVPGVHGRSSV